MTIEVLEPRRLFTAYFVDASRGNDSLSGRSARSAWETLAAVNDRSFHSGDKICLTGTFSVADAVTGAECDRVFRSTAIAPTRAEPR